MSVRLRTLANGRCSRAHPGRPDVEFVDDAGAVRGRRAATARVMTAPGWNAVSATTWFADVKAISCRTPIGDAIRSLLRILNVRRRRQADRIEPGDSWFEAICESYEHPPVFFAGRRLPGFPPEDLQIRTTGQAGRATLREASVFHEDCVSAFTQHGHPLGSASRLLDFGAGWGRIARFFLRELPIERIHGIDVQPDLIAICRETFASRNFTTVDPLPPTSLPDGAFSHVVGYSVFSHLSEAACIGWMEEFSRLVRPGGMVALTTRGRPFFDYCQSLQGKGHEGYLGALGALFKDFDVARALYDSGRFVHSNRPEVTGGGILTGAFYGESFIPKSYAQSAYDRWFELLEFRFDPLRHSHPIMFFIRR